MRGNRSFLMTVLLAVVLQAGAPLAYAAEEAAEKGKGGKEENVIGGRFKNDPIYVHIPPLIMPIINERGVEQLVTLLVDVEVRDFNAAALLQSNMPRVIDSLLQHLYGKLGEGNLKDGKLVNVVKIKKEAISAVSKVIGADKIHDVLLQGVAQRML